MKDVKLLRKTVGMKQIDLAKKLGINQSNYANIENGKLIPKGIDKIKKDALNILMPIHEKK